MRHWKSFDKGITDKEFLALPVDDRIALFEAMKMYRLGLPKGFILKSYGEGLLMIKPKSEQGRCLFFAEAEVRGINELVALLVYKKEGRTLPLRLRDLALRRLRLYKENQN